jgi:hypothetical protein
VTPAALRSFAASETGAVMVDWVVMTAATVVLGLTVTGFVSAGVENLAADLRNALANAGPGNNPFETNVDIVTANDVALQ